MEIVISNSQFGRNLRYLRIKRRITQKALAKLLGISTCSVRMMEYGTCEVTLTHQQMQLLCRELDVSVQELVHEDLLKEIPQ